MSAQVFSKYTLLVSPMRVMEVSREEKMPGEVANNEEQHEHNQPD